MPKTNFIQLKDYCGDQCLVAIDQIREISTACLEKENYYTILFKDLPREEVLELHPSVTLEDILKEINECE